MDGEIPFYPKKDGKLTPGRWEYLNTLLSLDILEHDETLRNFCRAFGISRQHIEAELATYRHDSPDTLQ